MFNEANVVEELILERMTNAGVVLHLWPDVGASND